MQIDFNADHICEGSKITSTLTRVTCYCGYSADVITDPQTGSIESVTTTGHGAPGVTHSWSNVQLDINQITSKN